MRIAIVAHELDPRPDFGLFTGRRKSPPHSQIDAVVDCLIERGHKVFHTDPGRRFRPADAAILHVNATVVPDACLALAARYPVCLNRAVRSIEKRLVSRDILARGSDWNGRVMIKSNANYGGLIEVRHNDAAAGRGRPAAFPGARPLPEYRVLDGIADVPDEVWDDSDLVVEKYRPETRDGLNVLRVWNFLGSYERASWYCSPETVVKGRNVVDYGPSEIPDLLRAERARLGFDYGKFDFAITPDGPVLYDANRTPAYLSSRPDLMRSEAPKMADGFLAHVAAAYRVTAAAG